MKVYKPHINDYGYPLGATDGLREALDSLGFIFPSPKISKGCPWGDVYFFNENLELAKSLMDSEDKHFLIETNKRYFYLSLYISRYEPEIGPHWQISHVVRKKEGHMQKHEQKPNAKECAYDGFGNELREGDIVAFAASRWTGDYIMYTGIVRGWSEKMLRVEGIAGATNSVKLPVWNILRYRTDIQPEAG